MAAKNQETKREEPSFETAIGRLESIVEEMESDKLPLEDLLQRYEEGVKLVKICSEKLQAAEKRIEIITRDAGGRAKAVPFEADQASAPADSGDVKLF
ncbi:MAG TPA: exodeoxyribonuclease VII small subunit [Chthoniobacteraceae bacterium]|nr:exodeoxyribonuclease VII small subunit [Chthoniobacteraceae bacterium]